jgi:hypothetical protein
MVVLAHAYEAKTIEDELNLLLYKITGVTVSCSLELTLRSISAYFCPQQTNSKLELTSTKIQNLLNILYDLSRNLIHFFNANEMKEGINGDIWDDYAFAHRKLEQCFSCAFDKSVATTSNHVSSFLLHHTSVIKLL